MRTKTLLLTAALAAAGALTSMAQSNVYSLNIVGYVNTTITGSGSGKFTMIANPLDAGTNTIGNLIPTAPDFTAVYLWTGSGLNIATFSFGSWDHPEYTLAPGQGAFINTGTTFSNTFVGNVLTGTLTNHFNAGFSIVASEVPQTDTADNLGLTAALHDFDTVYKWNFANQSYDIYTFSFGSWAGPNSGTIPPTINIAESVFLNTSSAGNWVRTFTPQ
jgi:hypothetical protein